MKRVIMAFALLLSSQVASLNINYQNAKAAYDLQIMPAFFSTTPSVPLCLPGVYMDNPSDCLPLGPSTYLTRIGELGMILPMTSPVTYKPDQALTQVTVRYGEVRNRNAPIFGSVQEALAGKKATAIQTIDSSFAFISYTDEAVVDGKRFYMVQPGGWMRAGDVSRLGAIPLFQGLLFRQTPQHIFGWILNYRTPEPIQTKRTPGYKTQDYTGHQLKHLDLVQVFGELQVDKDTWYMVGPDEWLPSLNVARVLPNPTPPEGVAGDRWIEVNLFDQTISVYDHRNLVFATLIASGVEPFWTRPGVFQIYEKLDTTPMRGSFEADRSDAYYLEDVPWTMYFDKARALHGAYWRAKLGFPQSHGCVNLSVGDAHWLYNWANLGDYVYVWDPSGQTPTDSAEYGSGGY